MRNELLRRARVKRAPRQKRADRVNFVQVTELEIELKKANSQIEFYKVELDRAKIEIQGLKECLDHQEEVKNMHG